MGGAAYQGVGCVGQSMEHILTDKPAIFSFHKWLQEVVDHLGVHGPFREKNEESFIEQHYVNDTSCVFKCRERLMYLVNNAKFAFLCQV